MNIVGYFVQDYTPLHLAVPPPSHLRDFS